MTVLGTLAGDHGAYVVRRARVEDVPALVTLLAADSLAAARGDDASGDMAPYRRAFAVLDDDPHQLLACLDDPDGAVVGTLQLTVLHGLSRRGAPRAQIEAVRIAEAARGRGLGTAFLRWAVDHARDQGCRVVQLTSDASRHDAHRFYLRLGFEHTHHGFKMALTPPS